MVLFSLRPSSAARIQSTDPYDRLIPAEEFPECFEIAKSTYPGGCDPKKSAFACYSLEKGEDLDVEVLWRCSEGLHKFSKKDCTDSGHYAGACQFSVLPSAEASTSPEKAPEVATTPEQLTEAATTLEQSTEAVTTPEQSTALATTPEQLTETATTPEQSTEAATTPKKTTEAATSPEPLTKAASTAIQSTEAATTPEQSTAMSTTPEQLTEAATTPEQSTEAATTPEQSTPVATTPEESTEAATTPEQLAAVTTTPEQLTGDEESHEAEGLPECWKVAKSTYPGFCNPTVSAFACYSTEKVYRPKEMDADVEVQVPWACSNGYDKTGISKEACSLRPWVFEGEVSGHQVKFTAEAGIYAGACQFPTTTEKSTEAITTPEQSTEVATSKAVTTPEQLTESTNAVTTPMQPQSDPTTTKNGAAGTSAGPLFTTVLGFALCCLQ